MTAAGAGAGAESHVDILGADLPFCISENEKKLKSFVFTNATSTAAHRDAQAGKAGK